MNLREEKRPTRNGARAAASSHARKKPLLRRRGSENPEGRMSLAEHFLELRKRLFLSALAIVIAAVAGWILSDAVWDILRHPVTDIAHRTGRVAQISYTDVTSSFDLKLRIAFFVALFLASPVWFYQVWAFFAPGLKRKEKLVGISFIASAVPLFLFGAATAWYVLPNLVHLLTQFSSEKDALLLEARNYLDFATKLMFAVGIGYVLPVFLVLLNVIGVLSGRAILRGWRVAVLLIALFAALTTPAADIVSMFLLMIPMIVLYIIAALIALAHDKRRAKREQNFLKTDFIEVEEE